jgi:hypothetical protein
MFEKWSSPESGFQILKALSRDQPCDITGIRFNDAAASKHEPAPGLTHALFP